MDSKGSKIFFPENEERKFYIDELLKLGVMSHEGRIINELSLIELKRKLTIVKATLH